MERTLPEVMSVPSVKSKVIFDSDRSVTTFIPSKVYVISKTLIDDEVISFRYSKNSSGVISVGEVLPFSSSRST
jgi:hypothetical protein